MPADATGEGAIVKRIDFERQNGFEFREGGSNATIRFAIGQCSLGAILVARSERGLCAITLGDVVLVCNYALIMLQPLETVGRT